MKDNIRILEEIKRNNNIHEEWKTERLRNYRQVANCEYKGSNKKIFLYQFELKLKKFLVFDARS